MLRSSYEIDVMTIAGSVFQDVVLCLSLWTSFFDDLDSSKNQLTRNYESTFASDRICLFGISFATDVESRHGFIDEVSMPKDRMDT